MDHENYRRPAFQVCKDLDEKSENLDKQVEKGGVKLIRKEIIYGAKK
jgi:hypothetical protein